jgi:hypothetical protein
MGVAQHQPGSVPVAAISFQNDVGCVTQPHFCALPGLWQQCAAQSQAAAMWYLIWCVIWYVMWHVISRVSTVRQHGVGGTPYDGEA